MSTFFVITSQARAGTHLLSSSLASHPQIVSSGEIFNPDIRGAWCRGTCPDKYLSEWEPAASRAAARGFVVHRWLLDEEPRLVDAILKRRPRIILLHRIRFLEMLCSERIAVLTGVWRVQGKDSPCPQSATVVITPEEAASRFATYRLETERDRARWAEARCPVLEMTYEHLVQSYDQAMLAVQNYLGVSRAGLLPGTHKQEHRHPRDIVRNWADLARGLAETEWAYLLEESSTH